MGSGNFHFITLCTVLVCLSVYFQDSNGQHGGRHQRRSQRLRNGGRRQGGMHPDIHRAYLNVFQPRTTAGPQMWENYVPRIPNANEVECYVEVMSIHLRGGRCIQLGGNTSRPYICQSAEQIEFSPYCQYIMEQAEAHQQSVDDQA